MVKTRRGYHLYFRHPGEPVPNAQRVPDETGKPRYDIRGDGGYVLAPPSRFDDGENKGEYRWVTMPIRSNHLPVFEAAWRPIVIPPPTPPSRDYDRIIHSGEAYIAQIRAVSGQGGHNATYRAVCRLKEAGLREPEAVEAMSAWNQTNAEPQWTRAELLHKVQSVYDRS